MAIDGGIQVLERHLCQPQHSRYFLRDYVVGVAKHYAENLLETPPVALIFDHNQNFLDYLTLCYQAPRIHPGPRIRRVAVKVLSRDETERIRGEECADRRIVIAVAVVMQTGLFIEELSKKAKRVRDLVRLRRLDRAKRAERSRPDKPPHRIHNGLWNADSAIAKVLDRATGPNHRYRLEGERIEHELPTTGCVVAQQNILVPLERSNGASRFEQPPPDGVVAELGARCARRRLR